MFHVVSTTAHESCHRPTSELLKRNAFLVLIGSKMSNALVKEMFSDYLFRVTTQATGNRIYVGNLAWTVEWQELKDHMRTVGKVVHADVLQDGDGRSKVNTKKAIIIADNSFRNF